MTDYGPWDPLTPDEMRDVMAATDRWWCLGGGYAPELFAGRSWRAHSDIDVLILRRDVEVIRAALPEWDLVLADNGVLREWKANTDLPAHVHDIWSRQGDGPWRFQLMVADLDGDDWVFRRDARIRGPLATMRVEIDEMPVLAPEIQFLYKAKQPNRPKDEQDFQETLPALDADRRQRLASWLDIVSPGHPWIALLTSM